MIAPEIERLIQLLAKLPGLGPRSARRAVLQLLSRPESLMLPLITAMQTASERLQRCTTCGAIDMHDPCTICADPARDGGKLCVVEEVSDLWAIERSGAFKGYYLVLGGTLSALDGRGPEQLNLAGLHRRLAGEPPPQEVILALSATVDGQTTAHYIADTLVDRGLEVTRLGHGVPVGGELNYLDDGTLAAAFRARRVSGDG